MPRRTDIESICVIGSGPIVIGQACEFDYAGCQALKVLREEGFRTIVVNSNPATIMTDPGFADRTYIEPLDLESVASVLERERPDALLPTLGGQTALNLAIALSESGVLDDHGVELIGAPVDVIRRAEDRELFRDAVRSCGLLVPASRIVTSLAQLDGIPLPAVVRPAFTLGGHGGGFADDRATLEHHVERGLWESPAVPSDKSLGYYHLFLRNKKGQAPSIGYSTEQKRASIFFWIRKNGNTGIIITIIVLLRRSRARCDRIVLA